MKLKEFRRQLDKDSVGLGTKKDLMQTLKYLGIVLGGIVIVGIIVSIIVWVFGR